MSVEDIKKKITKLRRDFDIISKQLPVLMEKIEALYPLEKMTSESTETENKSEVGKTTLPAFTAADMGARYKDLEDTVRRFLKELGEDEEEAGGGGTSSQTMPPSAEADE